MIFRCGVLCTAFVEVSKYPLNQIYYILFILQFGECQNTREKKETKKRKEKLGLV